MLPSPQAAAIRLHVCVGVGVAGETHQPVAMEPHSPPSPGSVLPPELGHRLAGKGFSTNLLILQVRLWQHAAVQTWG